MGILIFMKIRKISFYDEFKCAEGKCDETCCMGWLIPLDEDDLARYADVKGWLKLRLVMAMSDHSIPVFNGGCGKCPFHNRSGLCDLQVKRGHDFIPEVCRSYPRFFRNYGEFEERLVDLSCIEAARLFLKNSSCLHFADEEEGTPTSDLCSTNEDTGFLHALTVVRNRMTKAVMNASGPEELDSVFKAIDTYACRCQSHYVKSEDDYLTAHPFYEEDISDNGDTPDSMSIAPHTGSLFPLSAREIAYVADTPVYSMRLKKTNPGLYDLFTMYHGRYKKCISSENAWRDACVSFTGSHPEYVQYLGAYYSYYLYQYFLKTYEDYSFVKHVRIGFIHVSMILLFCILCEKEYGHLSTDRLAHIISVYNRRAYFNDEVIDRMYEVFYS